MGTWIRGASPRRLARKNRARSKGMVAVASAAMLSTVATRAHAQATPPAPQPKSEESREEKGAPTYELDPLTVEGEGGYKTEKPSSPKLTEPLRETPQSITVIPNEVIEDRGARSLREVLQGVPGITLAAGEGGGAQGDNLRIRGFAASTDLYLDGLRDITQQTRDPFNLESVEVVKGPASVYAGRGSTGGVVNQVSKVPRLETFLGGSFGAGTDGTFRATADVNHALADMPTTAFRLNVLGQTAEVAGRDIIEDDRWGVAPSVTWGLGTPTRVTASYQHLYFDGVPDYGHPFVAGRPAPVGRSTFYGFADLAFEKTEVDVGTLRIEHDFNDNIAVRNQLRYADSTRDAIVNPPRNANLEEDIVTINTPARDTGNQFIFNQLDAVVTAETAGVPHKIVAGFEVGREDFDFKALAFEGGPFTDSLLNPDPHRPFPGTRAADPTSDRETEADILAFYAFDTIEIGEWVEVVGGIRFDRFDAEFEDSVTGDAFDQTEEEFTYRAALVGKPLPYGSVYFAYGTSFNPSAEALALTEATANVDPEESETFEIGTKWDVLEERLALTAALFRIEKTNARTANLNPDDPVQVLDGEQRVDGFEVGAAGSITRDWAVFFGYAYLDSEILESNVPDEEGQEIINAPEHSMSLWTTYRLPYRAEVGFGIQYVDSRYANNTNTNQVGDYWLFDAMVGYQALENVAFRVNVYNLSDKFYYDRTHPQHTIPGPGRSALFTTTVSF